MRENGGAVVTGASPERWLEIARHLSRILNTAVLHWLSLGVAFVFLLWVNRDQWFFGDDWEFLTEARRAKPLAHELLDPHNEHWSTGPYLIFRALDATVGLDPYWPYVVPVLVAHLLLAHLLWRLALRVGANAWIATAGSFAFALLGAGYENLLWAFQIGFVGSVALGVAAMLAVDHHGPWRGRDSVGVAMAGLALTFSGIGILMLGVATLVVVLRRGWRHAAYFGAIPAGMYLLWSAVFYSGSQFAAPGLGAYLYFVYPYVLRGLTTAADLPIGAERAGASGAGLALLLILGGALIRHVDTARGRTATAYAGAVGAVGLYVLTAYGRWGLGVEQASASRYVYVANALLLPAVVLALTWLAWQSRLGVAVVCVGLAAVALNGVNQLREVAALEATREQTIRQTLIGAVGIASDSHELRIPGAVPEPAFTPDVTVADLLRWWRSGEIDTSATRGAELDAALSLQVGFTENRIPGIPVAEGACRQLVPGTAMLITENPPIAVPVISGGTAEIEVRLRDLATSAESEGRRLEVSPGRGYLNLLRSGVSASITQVDRTRIALCRQRRSASR
jgi:hypothetical protein